MLIIADQRKQKSGGAPHDIEGVVGRQIFPELQKILSKGPHSVLDIRKQLMKKGDWRETASSAAEDASAAVSEASKQASKLAAKAYSKLGSLFG